MYSEFGGSPQVDLFALKCNAKLNERFPFMLPGWSAEEGGRQLCYNLAPGSCQTSPYLVQ